MQKIRNNFHRPLSLTRLVVGSGIALFLAGVFLLQESGAAANISTARLNFIWAGWVLTAGWVLKRIEDRQWPFSPRLARRRRLASRRLRTSLACLFAVALGATIWRSYGPLMRDPMPVAAAAPKPDGSPGFLSYRGFLPVPSHFISLTNVSPAWNFDRLAAAGDRLPSRRFRFGFSSQVEAAPPALSGKQPSSWDNPAVADSVAPANRLTG